MSSRLHALMRLMRTVRYLRAEQIIGRITRTIQRPRLDWSPPPERRLVSGPWVTPPQRGPSMTGPSRFRFLNHERELDECGWDDPAEAKLWRYNLHYFDDLNAENAPERADWHRQLIARWIAECPAPKGTAWEAYPVSLRLINWIKWAVVGNAPSAEMLHQMAVQTRWLNRRLERHLLGNHLFINAKALFFAGHFFTGAEADRWIRTALQIFARELKEQFLADGAQFELSPMYHALGLEDLLDLINMARHFPGTAGASIVPELVQRAEAASHWMEAMNHPDGGFSFFNDTAFGIAPTSAALLAYGQSLGLKRVDVQPGARWLAASGYARLQNPDALLLADLAAIGPDYLPGHAHADTLSFEFSLGDERVFVNSGTSVYGIGDERHRQRGTAAHNTVVVADQNSSEIWSGFRVGRRAKVSDAVVGTEEGALIAAAQHDGYAHLTGNPIHRRRFALASKKLVVSDWVSGDLPAVARYHFHPNVSVNLVENQKVLLTTERGRTMTVAIEGGAVAIEPSSWHPEFGVSIDNFCLVVPLVDGKAQLCLAWT